jgi:integrase/recombinase XerC
MRVFTEWARGRGLLSYDVMQGVDVVEQVELPPRWLERKDLGRFMRQLEMGLNGSRSGHWRWQAVRDLAVAAMMVYAGLRDGEVCGLDVGDIALGDRSGRVMVRLGKGEKFRKVPLNGEARRAIRAWLEVRGAACGSLFIGKGGERISTRLVQRRMAEVGRQAGLVVRPHDLRHTFAKRLLDEGTPLTVVSKLLGHSRLETTARYVQPGWSDFEIAVEAI